MEWLTHGQLIDPEKQTHCSLVLYFKQGAWQHVGIETGQARVTSQWGTFSDYEHNVGDI
jgi:hypothetical protein